jgi:hypothetical protein
LKSFRPGSAKIIVHVNLHPPNKVLINAGRPSAVRMGDLG